MTVHGVVYGCSRFVNGFWADRLNGRIFMTAVLWGVTLGAISAFALVGMILFLLAWRSSANGYGKPRRA